ncbi:unnamed protein product [Sympodiomycopsis kandeliae]
MPSPVLDSFTTALITGGGGGLGFTIAEYLLSQGKKVILVGRTESNLKEASEKLSNAPYYVLDTGKVSDIPAFTEKVIKEHPEVDCLVNNAGVQRPLHVTKLDLQKLDQEIDINVRGPVYLIDAFLEHFSKKSKAAIMNVTSVLGYIPFSIINPSYNASKAYLHFYTETLRTQLKETNIRVIEVAPPAVHTKLHREREDPDDYAKNPVTIDTKQFIKQVSEQWQEGKDVISAGPGVEIVKKWYDTFGDALKGPSQAWQGKQVGQGA